MPLNEPSWWYGTDALNAWTARALSPLSTIYGLVADRRLARSDGLQSSVPVICVGNFTAGGTGKTPFVRWLVARVKQRGLNPVLLTRGFGGHLAGPVWVQAAQHTAAEVGDEPLLLVKHAPVMVARDRADGLRAIARNDQDFDVVIMDDGLQNPSIHKDLTIAVIDGKRGFGNGRVIPAGPLRASLSRQVPRVSAVVINHGSGTGASMTSRDTIAGELHQHGFRGPVIDATISVAPNTTVSATEAGTIDAAALAGQRVFAYAGIGHPERFFETLRSLGADLIDQRVFADHHVVSASQADALVKSAAAQDLRLVTTEKDWVRLADTAPELRELKASTLVVPITMKISEAAYEQIAALLETCMSKNAGHNR